MSDPARTDKPNAFFVYGTLKCGEINHSLLAPYARSIEPGWITGLLYDTGDFPALVEEDGRVYGEIITVDSATVDLVLTIVDRLENCVPGDDAASMYIRRVLEVTMASGGKVPAFAYVYNPSHPALPPLDVLRRLPAGIWSGPERPPDPTGNLEFEAYRQWVRSHGEAK